MSKHVQFVREQINGASVVAAEQAINQAVVLTDEEIVTGRAGLFGRWGAKLERRSLERLSSVQLIPNPSANMLRIFFADSGEALTIMYSDRVRAGFEQMITALERRLDRTGDGAR